MKKGKAIGIGFAVIAVAIIVGIASLPDDDVLNESPVIDTSTNIPPENIPIDVQSEEISSVEQTKETEPVEETEPIEETTSSEEESEGKVIEVKINDGVGSGDK